MGTRLAHRVLHEAEKATVSLTNEGVGSVRRENARVKRRSVVGNADPALHSPIPSIAETHPSRDGTGKNLVAESRSLFVESNLPLAIGEDAQQGCHDGEEQHADEEEAESEREHHHVAEQEATHPKEIDLPAKN